MRKFSVYDAASGAFLRHGVARDVEAQAQAGELVFEGVRDPVDREVRGGKLLMIPKAKRDQLAKAEKWAKVRARRAGFLTAFVDTIGPARWASLNAAERAELATYRQALLDLPTSTNDPDQIAWPDKPSFSAALPPQKSRKAR